MKCPDNFLNINVKVVLKLLAREALMARPFKVLIPEQKEQFGVVARSLRVLRDSIQRRYGLQSGFKIFLTDGTTVDNEEYFAFLEPQTLLIVKHAIPSGDTKTSGKPSRFVLHVVGSLKIIYFLVVVDLTSKLASKQVEALVCTEKHSEGKISLHFGMNFVNSQRIINNKRMFLINIQ